MRYFVDQNLARWFRGGRLVVCAHDDHVRADNGTGPVNVHEGEVGSCLASATGAGAGQVCEPFPQLDIVALACGDGILEAGIGIEGGIRVNDGGRVRG